MAKREVYVTSVGARLSLWTTQPEKLRDQTTEQVGSACHKQLDAWKLGIQGIADRLAELRSLDATWYVIKSEVEKGLRAIEAALGHPELVEPAYAESVEPQTSVTPGRPSG